MSVGWGMSRSVGVSGAGRALDGDADANKLGVGAGSDSLAKTCSGVVVGYGESDCVSGALAGKRLGSKRGVSS